MADAIINISLIENESLHGKFDGTPENLSYMLTEMGLHHHKNKIVILMAAMVLLEHDGNTKTATDLARIIKMNLNQN